MCQSGPIQKNAISKNGISCSYVSAPTISHGAINCDGRKIHISQSGQIKALRTWVSFRSLSPFGKHRSSTRPNRNFRRSMPRHTSGWVRTYSYQPSRDVPPGRPIFIPPINSVISLRWPENHVAISSYECVIFIKTIFLPSLRKSRKSSHEEKNTLTSWYHFTVCYSHFYPRRSTRTLDEISRMGTHPQYAGPALLALLFMAII